MMMVKKVSLSYLKAEVRKPFFWFCVVFILANLLFTKQALTDVGLNLFFQIAVVEVLIEVGVVVLLKLMKEKNAPLEKQFFLVAMILGIMFIMLLPPGQSPDDKTHFRRAYGISDGILMPGALNDSGEFGGLLPSDITDNLYVVTKSGTYAEMMHKIGDGDWEEQSVQSYTGAALYSFVCYIPQTIAILFGKMMHFSILGMAYLVEIVNFAIFVLLIFFSIKLIPRFKSIVILISLLPITLQEATALGPDALTIGLSIFLISYVLYLTFAKEVSIGMKETVILSVMAIVIGFCKIVYLPLLLLYIMIPYEKFGGKKKKWLYLIVLGLFVFILNLCWLVISSRLLTEAKLGSGVNSGEQLLGLLRNPLKYLLVIINSANVNGHFWLMSMLGMSLGAFEINLPNLLFYSTLVLVIIVFAQRSDSLKLSVANRWLVAIVFVLIFGLICTSLYIQWTPYDNNIIEGIQGRYFLPILLLIPIVICRIDSSKNYPVLVSDKTIMCYSVFLNVMAFVVIFTQNI